MLCFVAELSQAGIGVYTKNSAINPIYRKNDINRNNTYII
jgi:hypothetical protein